MDEVKNDAALEVATNSEKRFRTFKYIAALVAWGVTLIGVIVDYTKDNPLPKKTADEYNN